ncbi:leucine-rich repeat, immunoglobulin-like domain-containing kekkon 3 protein [Lycorma delicatula]|uniref:leucine-rich repeat, immunoglobulin-like domain-containing kekkon 3 protein n=1 Tax=Lycorma delicatula TaxID=130591 RepID=UPI003F51370F
MLWRLQIAWLVLVAVKTVADCPSACECKWKNGKEAVFCMNTNLTGVPQHLDSGTQVLDLTGNPITSVERDAFRTANLLNLQKVFLAKCRIKSIDRYAFRKLTNLVELDLSYNHLPAVPSHAFESVSELRELKLNGNPIQRLLNDAFINLPQLVRLDISDCRLGTIEPKAFNGLQNTLEWLKLDKNKLTDVRSTTLTSLDSLHGLELTGNPWNCSCGLRSLREWMLRQNIPYSIPPVCKFPRRLSGRTWDKLELDEFACTPSIAVINGKVQAEEGRNISMSCRVGGSPRPAVRWLWKNRVVANISSGLSASSKKLYVLHLFEDTSRLTILAVEMQDAGTYFCVAENKAGRAQGNVTLSVTQKINSDVSIASWKVLLASVLIAALFLLASCLAVLCMCVIRQKNALQSSLRRGDSYEKIELNHKPATVVMNHSGVPKGANGYSEVAVVGPLKQHPRHSEYRGIPADERDADVEEEDETSRCRTALPENEHRVQTGQPSLQNTRRYWEEDGVQQHVMRKEILPQGTLYTTAAAQEEINFPDLLGSPPLNSSQDISAQQKHDQNDRLRSRGLVDTRKAAVSESQSPLLPGSRYSSSDSANSRGPGFLTRSSSTYRLSTTDIVSIEERSCSTVNLNTSTGVGRWRHPSLPTSPVLSEDVSSAGASWRHPSLPVSPVLTETPILNILDPSIYSPSIAATTYDYHAAQLERFLEEYRSLQEQLSKMKETCENMRLKEPAESSRLVEPLSVQEENPRSILKNKNKSQPSSTGNPYWVPRDSLFDSAHGSDIFQS